MLTRTATGVIASYTEAMAAGNVIAGGFIRLAPNRRRPPRAMNKYADRTSITMIPIQGCRA